MTIHIGFTKRMDFTVDKDDNLSIVKRSEMDRDLETVTIGFLTPHLIDSMIESLNRLRPFAK
jgi:hypothetical protein